MRLPLALTLLLAGCAAAPLQELHGVDALLLGEQHDAGTHPPLQERYVRELAGSGRLGAVALEMAERGTSTAGLPAAASEEQVRTALVAGLWWAILLAIAWALALGWLFGRWLHRRHAHRIGGDVRSQWATSWFAGTIGGASEMTLLAEREGGRSDLVAAAHTVRLVIVTLLIPFALQYSGLHGMDPGLPGARGVQWGGLALVGALTAAGGWLMARTGRANPWFMGALLAAMGITMAGLEWSAMPAVLSNAAQLVIGVSLGVRFQREFLTAAPRWLADVALGTLGMVVLCGGFALLLGWATGLHPATLVLGTSPGGIAEMAITAKVLQLGVPVVTAFQVCRLVAVLVLVEPLYRRAAPS
ncbi:MAG: AbrB family transcriptional regulator [Comamonadaceae bacterium]|nr:MAG: AbrB family transcriptional regulator [Comamonadaceae bacterium]